MKDADKPLYRHTDMNMRETAMKGKNSIYIPVDFQYRTVLLKGKPRHEQDDPFLIRHPRMDLSRRAKIFLPFDALKGFREACQSSSPLSSERSAFTADAI